jgi:hypothetical protein
MVFGMKTNLKLLKRINYKKKLDTVVSKYIRQEGQGRCAFHQKIAEKGLLVPCVCNGVLQCCHKVTRKNLSTRFDLRNLFCGCSASNVWANWNQAQWDSLWRLLWPEDSEYLEQQKIKKCKIDRWAYKILIDEFTEKLK